jgi:tetratricopeptide (TPR) repeat protein
MQRSVTLALSSFVLLLAACATPAARTAFEDGVSLYRDGYYLSAREAFDTALRQEPEMASAWNNRGVARARLGDLEGAVLDYTEAMRRAPTDAEYVFNRGNAYAAGGNLAQALADYTTAVTLRPDYAQAFYNRGTVRAATRDMRGAAEDWRFAVALERDPWTRAAMERGAPVEGAYAMPRAVAGGVTVMMPASSPAVPSGAVAGDAPSLVARAMDRELNGDRLGAIVDLRAAQAAETDPARRTRIDAMIRLLETAR